MMFPVMFTHGQLQEAILFWKWYWQYRGCMAGMGTGIIVVNESDSQCDYTDTLYVNIGPVGVPDYLSDYSIRLFPNPVNGRCQLKAGMEQEQFNPSLFMTSLEKLFIQWKISQEKMSNWIWRIVHPEFILLNWPVLNWKHKFLLFANNFSGIYIFQHELCCLSVPLFQQHLFSFWQLFDCRRIIVTNCYEHEVFVVKNPEMFFLILREVLEFWKDHYRHKLKTDCRILHQVNFNFQIKQRGRRFYADWPQR